ncbi:hypothetical protein DCAR_0206643 [Daucus carota subsp. sativus]|uniref:FBD domain-containing protein n=2 Tax=Daucus carota subsp. sativus TaxID=79200 RepID=A0A166DC35_DAUCS|nr:hypothetical protein DCAR_0206643 [Daucus carota subsp. sativus]
MPVDLIKLLGDTPSISHLYVNGYTVEVLGQPFYPTLKGVAPRIEILRLLGLQFKNVCQLYNSLSLIRCLSNLRVLMIELKPGTRSLDPTVGQRMEKPCWKDVLLHQLHTLTILDVVVDTRVLSLIKTLLAVSPSLKKIFFHFSNVKADAYAEMSKIKKLFRQCPRKSLSAKIYLSFQNPRNIVTQPNRYSSHLGALWFELH